MAARRETPTGEKEQQGRGGGRQGLHCGEANPLFIQEGNLNTIGSGSLSAPPHGCSLLISVLFPLLFVLVCEGLQMKLLSLRYHTPRLCRIAVFLIQTIVLSHEFMRHLPVRVALKTVNPGIAMPTIRLPDHLGGLGLAPMVQFSSHLVIKISVMREAQECCGNGL